MTLLRLIDKDNNLVDELSIPSPFLVGHPHLQAEETNSHAEVRLPNVESPSPGPPDVLVGRIPVAGFPPHASPQIGYLTVPPPSPFSPDAVDRMWEDINYLPAGIPPSVPTQGLGPFGARVHDLASTLHFTATLRAVQAARDVLARWPLRETRQPFYRATELPGGREDPLATSRSAGRTIPILRIQQRALPSHSWRWQGRLTNWTCRPISVAAQQLAIRLRQRPPYSDSGFSQRFLPPLHAVAYRSRPPRGVPDLPPASWPQQFRRLHTELTLALRAHQLSLDQSALAPLSHFWRLYEAWITARLYQELLMKLGPPTKIEASGTHAWSASWRLQGSHVSLYVQPVLTSTPLTTGSLQLISVTSHLVPDALLTISNENEELLFIIDAKRREAPILRPADAAVAASKYLWGIRTATDPEKFPVNNVLLATTSTSLGPLDDDLARYQVFQILPQDDEQRILDYLATPLLSDTD